MGREGRWGRSRAPRGEAVEPAGGPRAVDEAPREPGEDAEAAADAPADDRADDRAGGRADDRADDRAGGRADDRADDEGGPARAPFRIGNLTPFLLVRAAHPRQALLTAIGLAIAAALAGRPGREVLLVLGTVLVGQVVLGWFNDLVDRRRDARHHRPGKPLADGRLDPGTVWFCLALAVFLVVPLSFANGLYAGSAYLISLAIGLAGHWPWLRKGLLSWLPWAAAFALYPAFLSYGGWGGQARGAPPELLMTALAALLGVGVHLLTALWGLVSDNEDGWTYLPLKLGLRIGASRLLWVTVAYTVLVLVALAVAGTHVGLAQEPV